MSTYQAIWPITDMSLPFLALITEARRDLPNLVRLAHVRVTGAGRWSVAESRHVPGSGGVTPWVLIYEAPAEQWRPADEPDPDTAQWVNPDRAAALADLEESGAGLAEVLRRLGLKEDTLERWCLRNGHNATFCRLKARDRRGDVQPNQYTKKAS